jgi:CRP-like cAMP-binding protein
VELFAGLSKAMIETVVLEAEYTVYAPNTQICREGEYTADFYVLLSGLVGVYKADTEKGGDATKYLGSLPSGAWFGEMSCMSHAPRSATVVAESDVVLLGIPRHTFMKCYGDKKSPDFKKLIDGEYRERALGNHLATVSLFRGIPRKVLQRVGEVAELAVFDKGTAIISEGEAGDAFYLVRTGHAKVTRDVNGDEEILAWLCENSFFGELALVRDVPRSSSVVAVDRMDVVRIAKDPFLNLLEDFPDVKGTVFERVERLFDEEFVTDEEAAARTRAREIGTEHEVIKAGDALVIDMSKCTHCNMCVEGCIEAHEDRIPRIGKRGISFGDLLLTSSCYNCKVPDCMLACKFGAIRRDRAGQVHIDPDACTGCSLCEPACPYGTIHMQSLIGEEMEVKANPVVAFLSKIPGLSVLAKGKEPEPEPEAKGGKKKLRQAVKCDLCSGRADMACIYNCPCGAIERIDPNILLESQ